MKEKPRSCPFCGNRSPIIQREDGVTGGSQVSVRCGRCAASGPQKASARFLDDEIVAAEKAIIAWNSRLSPIHPDPQ